MPKRTDIETVLVIGSGPIVIGQACEFDYSGTQACKALREEGYRVVLVNSNPATIMTDPEFADATYIEPITPEVVAAIIERERPDALLPTLGGQTALNVTMQLAERGTIDKFGVELIGAGLDAIEAAEDRGRFKEVMDGIGVATAHAAYVRTLDDALTAAEDGVVRWGEATGRRSRAGGGRSGSGADGQGAGRSGWSALADQLGLQQPDRVAQGDVVVKQYEDGGVYEGTFKDGKQEDVSTGDMFYWPPGHTVRVDEDYEAIEFSPSGAMAELMNHLDAKLKG